MPNMNPQSVTLKKFWQMFKSRSKVRVKVTHSTFMLPLERPCHKEHNLWLMIEFFRSRSKVTVKVTCSKFMVPPERSCHKEHTCQI